MMRWWIAVTALAVVGSAECQGQSPVLQAALKKNGWHTSYEAARTAARQSGKPMLVVFRCQP